MWVSSKSVGVDFMPPTIERLASLCSLTIYCSMPTEPVLCLWPSGFVGGVYQTLRAYVCHLWECHWDVELSH